MEWLRLVGAYMDPTGSPKGGWTLWGMQVSDKQIRLKGCRKDVPLPRRLKRKCRKSMDNFLPSLQGILLVSSVGITATKVMMRAAAAGVS
jgi:hypothetical protein